MRSVWHPRMWADRVWHPRVWLVDLAVAVFAAVGDAVRRVAQLGGIRGSQDGGRYEGARSTIRGDQGDLRRPRQ